MLITQLFGLVVFIPVSFFFTQHSILRKWVWFVLLGYCNKWER